MGQKVNPISFRLQTSKNWNSRWFASKKDFAVWLAEDGKIRDLIEKRFASLSSMMTAVPRASSPTIPIRAAAQILVL